MRSITYSCIILLTALTSFSQTAIVDSVHPYFGEKELNWKKLNEKYDNFFLAIGTRKIIRSHNHVNLSLFHSNELFTHTILNKNENLKELNPFKIKLPGGSGFAVQGNSDIDAGSVAVFDSLPVFVTAYGIDEKTRNDFKFRVLKNMKQELVPWTAPRFFTPVMLHYQYNADGTEQKKMAYLGAFKAPVGSSITVEVKSVHYPDTVYKISAVWVKRAPSVIGVFSGEKLKQLISVYKYQWKHDFNMGLSSYYGNVELKPVDSLLQKTNKFSHDENNLFFYLKDKVKSADLVEYCLLKDKDSTRWTSNLFDPNIISLTKLKPGNYSLIMRYSFQRQTTNAYTFSIKPAWYQTNRFYIILGALTLILLVAIAAFFGYFKQRKKLKRQLREKQRLQIELKAIRSQFNPHFVFNALNSIQGLIRKKDVHRADNYLSEFSQLMRESLQAGNNEMVSLDKEIKMLKSYIELEKLRFGFNYEFNIGDNINLNTTEIPTLLLQPLIENAIKHGIAHLYENGRLFIIITISKNDMCIIIKDNGKGFGITTPTSGYGLKLTRERVLLLSELNPSQPIVLSMESHVNGTTAKLFFKNWLL